MCSCFRTQVLVPPQVLGVIVLLEESCLGAVEICLCSQLHGITEKRKVKVSERIQFQGACIHSCHAIVGRDIVMKGLSLSLGQFSSDTETVSRPCVQEIFVAVILYVRHLETAVFIADETLQSCLGIFVETFEECYGKGVLDREVFILVIDGVIPIFPFVIIFVERVHIIVGRTYVCLIDTAMTVEINGVNETGDRHILPFHGGIDRVLMRLGSQQTVHLLLRVYLDTGGVVDERFAAIFGKVSGNTGILRTAGRDITCNLATFSSDIGVVILFFVLTLLFLLCRSSGKLACLDFFFRHFHLPIETNVVTVREVEMDGVITVPVLGENSRYFLLAILIIETLRMGNVIIVGDTSVLR